MQDKERALGLELFLTATQRGSHIRDRIERRQYRIDGCTEAIAQALREARAEEADRAADETLKYFSCACADHLRARAAELRSQV